MPPPRVLARLGEFRLRARKHRGGWVSVGSVYPSRGTTYRLHQRNIGARSGPIWQGGKTIQAWSVFDSQGRWATLLTPAAFFLHQSRPPRVQQGEGENIRQWWVIEEIITLAFSCRSSGSCSWRPAARSWGRKCRLVCIGNGVGVAYYCRGCTTAVAHRALAPRIGSVRFPCAEHSGDACVEKQGLPIFQFNPEVSPYSCPFIGSGDTCAGRLLQLKRSRLRR